MIPEEVTEDGDSRTNESTSFNITEIVVVINNSRNSDKETQAKWKQADDSFEDE